MPFVYAAPLHPGSTDVVYTAADGTKTLRRGGSRAWRNNNPGNIESGKFAKSQGAIGQTGRFAVFPDVQTGRAAVFALLHKSIYINSRFESKLSHSGLVNDLEHRPSESSSIATAVEVNLLSLRPITFRKPRYLRLA